MTTVALTPPCTPGPVAAVTSLEERARWHTVLDTCCTLAVLLDLSGRVITMGPRTAAWLKVDADGAVGQPIWELAPFTARATAEGLRSVVASPPQSPVTTALMLTKGDAPPLLVKATICMLCDGPCDVLVLTAADATEEMIARGRLERSQALLDAALDSADLGVYEFSVQSNSVWWDDKLRDIWGLPKDAALEFDSIVADIHPDDRERHRLDLERALSPDSDGVHLIDMRIWHRPSGDWRWIHVDGKAFFKDGTPVRLVGMVSDITARRREQELRELLIHELNHRVKNLFGIIQGMVAMTARTSTDTASMAHNLRERIVALARAHEIIRPAITLEAVTEPAVPLDDLVGAVVAPHVDNPARLALEGDPFHLKSEGVTALALLLHELTTNAVKYGALRGDCAAAGRVRIAWAVDAGDVRLVWTEEGGPPLTGPPQSTGFGSRLVDLTVSHQLRGTLQRDWRQGGFCIEITVPKERVAA